MRGAYNETKKGLNGPFIHICFFIIGGNSPDIPLTAPRLIAHAGGDIYGIRMTNSLQALDRSYEEGFRFIEVDICLTSDGVPVLLHDWGNANWFAGIGYSTEQPHWVE